MHKLYKLACNELMELEQKADQGLSMSDLEYAKELTELKKNIMKCWWLEDQLDSGYSGNYSGNYSNRGSSYRGSYDMGNRGGIGNLDGESLYSDRSYARGRRYARRDSMGRYSRAEDDMDSMVQELRMISNDLPEDKRNEVQSFIKRLESMK